MQACFRTSHFLGQTLNRYVKEVENNVTWWKPQTIRHVFYFVGVEGCDWIAQVVELWWTDDFIFFEKNKINPLCSFTCEGQSRPLPRLNIVASMKLFNDNERTSMYPLTLTLYVYRKPIENPQRIFRNLELMSKEKERATNCAPIQYSYQNLSRKNDTWRFDVKLSF